MSSVGLSKKSKRLQPTVRLFVRSTIRTHSFVRSLYVCTFLFIELCTLLARFTHTIFIRIRIRIKSLLLFDRIVCMLRCSSFFSSLNSIIFSRLSMVLMVILFYFLRPPPSPPRRQRCFVLFAWFLMMSVFLWNAMAMKYEQEEYAAQQQPHIYKWQRIIRMDSRRCVYIFFDIHTHTQLCTRKGKR